MDSPTSSNFPVLIIALIGILSTAFLLVSYYIFVIKCCLNWHRIDLLRHLPRSNRRSATDPPPGFSLTIVSHGLEASLIRLIPVIRFKNEENQETEHLECAICLSEFNEDEKLRVIPNCCHAFHIDCIDVWLQSQANCPVCRSGISSNSLCASDRFTGNDEDYVVIDIVNNDLVGSGDLSPITIFPSPWKMKELRSSLDDECVDMRSKEDLFDRVHPIRRSISMDLSSSRRLCSEIQDVLGDRRYTQSLRRSFFSFGSGRSSVRHIELK